jgi:hypothetical protein
VGEFEDGVLLRGRYVAVGEQQTALVGAEVPQRDLMQKRLPRDITAPGSGQRVPPGENDYRVAGKLRNERIAQPSLQRFQRLEGIQQNHLTTGSAGKGRDHFALVRKPKLPGKRLQQAIRRRFDVAGI